MAQSSPSAPRPARVVDLVIAFLVGLFGWGAAFVIGLVLLLVIGLPAGAGQTPLAILLLAVPTLFSGLVLWRNRAGKWGRAEQIAFVVGILVALVAALLLARNGVGETPVYM